MNGRAADPFAAFHADTFVVEQGPPFGQIAAQTATVSRWRRGLTPVLQRGDQHSISDGDPDWTVVVHMVSHPPLRLHLDPWRRLGLFCEDVRSYLSAPRGGRLRIPHLCPAMQGSPLHLFYDAIQAAPGRM